MAEAKLLGRIRDELKRTIRLLQAQLRHDHPADRLYAVLFEVDVSEMYVIRIAGSEESLTRLAEKYIAKGYRTRSGDLLETLRTLLRWDAPGDDKVGWYWGNQDEDAPVTQMIDQAVQTGLIRKYDESQPLRRLCIDALPLCVRRRRRGDVASSAGGPRTLMRLSGDRHQQPAGIGAPQQGHPAGAPTGAVLCQHRRRVPSVAGIGTAHLSGEGTMMPRAVPVSIRDIRYWHATPNIASTVVASFHWTPIH